MADTTLTAPATVHLILTNESPYGWSMTSPQLPGFVYGRPTKVEFERDASSVLDAVLADTESGTAEFHFQVRGASAAEDLEYVVRWAADRWAAERREVAAVLVALLSDAKTSFVGLEPDVAETLVFICARREDRLRWFTDQLPSEGMSAHLVVLWGAEGLLRIRTVLSDDLGREGDVARDDQDGLTLGELMESAPTIDHPKPIGDPELQLARLTVAASQLDGLAVR